MKKNMLINIHDETSLKTLAKNAPDLFTALTIESADEIPTTSNHEIATFKVEQIVVDMTSSNSLNVGGFANGNANIKNLKTRYLVVMYSNKFENIIGPDGQIIRKRYGYGFGFTLNVKDIETKLSFDFGKLAASSALGLANVGYKLNVPGVVDANLAQYLPENSGKFDRDAYKKLKKFIRAAKKHFLSSEVIKLYPIEILKQEDVELESEDTKSIYFGVLKVSEGLSLKEAIEAARRSKTLLINENILFFIYRYFELDNAYDHPNQNQKQNARRWITGRYNKVEELGANDDSWVSIEPSVEDGKFVALCNLPEGDVFRPHPKPQNWSELPKKMDDEFSEVSLDFSTSFRLSSIINATGKFNTITLVRDFALYTDVSGDQIPGNKVIETRYGVGIRLVLKISNIEFGTKINFATVGAASELGHVNIEYEFSGIGISDPSILKELPEPHDNFTEEAKDEIVKAFKKILKKISDMDASEFNPQPYRIRVNEPDKIDPTLRAQAIVFGIGKVASRTKLKDAITEGQKWGIAEQPIRDAYKEIFEITEEHKRPSFSDSRNAKNWLIMEY